MHPYSITGTRWRKVGYLMLIAVFIADFFNSNLTNLFSILPLLTENNIPSGLPTFSIFAVLYIAWNKYLWAFPIISKFTNPPDLRGTWVGGLESSYEQTQLGKFATDGGNDVPDGPKMKIRQTWTHISVTIYFKDSVSTSTTAAFLQDMTDPVLRINYRNRPEGGSGDDLIMHEGTNDLRYENFENSCTLSGKYYTDEHRNNHGEVSFQRVDRNRLFGLTE